MKMVHPESQVTTDNPSAPSFARTDSVRRGLPEAPTRPSRRLTPGRSESRTKCLALVILFALVTRAAVVLTSVLSVAVAEPTTLSALIRRKRSSFS